ncbi:MULTISPECIES: hypothetical protein [unclassified Bradyrhizobium]|uniref:hypothetical protein n=1 Tax=unclassified Bradyrhizobium TaxID=2631580 RepID=UPI002916C58E|nr:MULTISPECIES: hypothetical protein [unclassified Bradyrhizobium]
MLSAGDLGLCFVAAGATLVVVVGGMWGRDVLARRRPRRDVFDFIEPPRLWLAPVRCTCSARLKECACALDGVRNPRGAGRARTRPRVEPDMPWPRSAPRPLGCPSCRDHDCSTPAVCGAAARLFPTHN